MRLVLNVHDDDYYFPYCSSAGVYLLGHKSAVGGQIRPASSQVTASSSAQGQLGLKKIVIFTIDVLVSS